VSHPFVFRPGTPDEGVFEAINVHNEYRLPDAFAADDIVIDVGMHIGSFCHAALVRGSDHVHGFEPFAENFAAARRNLAPFGDRVRVCNKAVWRSDRPDTWLDFTACSHNNGGGVVWRDQSGQGPRVETIAFDDIVREVTGNGARRVRMVKLDCEASEYPILLSSRTLHLVDEIVGEFHELGTDDHPHGEVTEINGIPGYDRYTMNVLKGALERANFRVEVVPHELYPREPIGWFFATRAPAPAHPALRGPFLSGLSRMKRTIRGLITPG
jgi:FkbM family methyltransferase